MNLTSKPILPQASCRQ
uniref:Uncharacterized protein n=1 Tax=Anguilla anguilla TaxID=7936 RepID=A0A0E9XR52_ANGAN